MPISEPVRPQMLEKLRLLYGDAADAVLHRIDELADRYASLGTARREGLWDERSVVLITYGDQVQDDGRHSLQVLQEFMLEHELDHLIRAIHLLPFFPYSSDDGFSVMDYRRVDERLGDWADVDRLAQSFGLMFDFVVNHCSQHHEWFQRYLRGESPQTDYFIEADPATDLSTVTRPRSTPLLTPFETNRGTKHVWTTFSADQVDLNFANPDVLIEMLDILLLYVRHGAKVLRLDAIGFLWKTIGTTCMHLPETHAAVKLMRHVLDDVAPGTILLTETNVPHEENISYFGDGDEARAVYQFSLAPLLLDAFLTGDAGPLSRWLSELEYPRSGMTFFNFTASHDGIGVRPLEGLVSGERLNALVDGVRQRGGLVNTRRNPDGSDSPYELNITYFSACDSPSGLPPDVHARKFLASQGLMLALRGVPGIYFHSLVGTPNDSEGVAKTGHNRTINRRKFQRDELRDILRDERSAQRLVFDGYRKLLEIRTRQTAFHPDADQTVLDAGHPSIVAFTRTRQEGDGRILVLVNVADRAASVDLARLDGAKFDHDLLSGRAVSQNKYEVGPYEIAWLA